MAARHALTLAAALCASAACRPARALPAAEGRVVTLHYTLKAGRTFVASTETTGAVTVRLGEGDGLLLGLRKGAIGMKPGEERAFSIPPEDGFPDGDWAGRVLQARIKIVSVREEAS